MSKKSHSDLTRKGVQDLQKLLRSGLTVVSEIWNSSTGDWVSSVQAADIDGDGDIEVLLGSRDSNVYVLTKSGALKWKLAPGGEWIRSIQGVNNADSVDDIRLVIGTRDSKVQAFDENRELRWQFLAGHVVRQVVICDIDQDDKTEVIVASEDQCVYALSSATGAVIWKYRTDGWVHAIHVIDLDQDGQVEILAASSDKTIHVLDHLGQLKRRYQTTSELQSLFAVDIDQDGQVEILAATDGKELCALTVAGDYKWRSSFDNRLRSITTADLNNDGRLEIIAASEDKHLYVLDDQGRLLWRHNLSSRVFSVYAIDIDNDGLIEVIAGTEDSVHVLRIELLANLREKIISAYERLGQPPTSKIPLAATEKALLQDIFNERPQDEQPLSLEIARKAAQAGEHLQALSTLVLLNQQKVQLLWRQKVGRVRAVFSGDLNDDGLLEIVAGTDDGGIYVFNTFGEELWSYLDAERIWTVYIGDIDLDGTLEVVAGSGSGWLYVFSNTGQIKWKKKMDDRVETVYINEEHPANYAEMVIGLRGNQGKIQVYDNHFTQAIPPINTPHGVRVVGTYDLDNDGAEEIIAGGDDDNVYAYKRDGRLHWTSSIGDSARGLVIRDIDADGRMEIIVGSEDRNVHVLDSDGQLKWRYYTPHRVLSVNTLDLDQDGEMEVFLGIDDGYVLFLSKTGDLLWKYQVGDRVCGVQAADCNQDGKIEIIVGSEDHMLYLLQVLKLEEVADLMEQSWQALQQEAGANELVYDLARNPEPSLRSFALTRITTQPALQERDLAILQKLIRDASGDVRYVFAQAIAGLYQANPNPARRFMDILLADPERDVKLALVDALPAIAQIDVAIGFQYLERFSKSVDAWIRRSVVRNLDLLAASFPQRVFRLLLNLVDDERDWIRQEVARSLAHYFDLYEEKLIGESRDLVTRNIDLAVLKLIASNATRETVRQIFLVAVDMQERLSEGNVLERLENTVSAYEKTRGLKNGEEMWQIYNELYLLHRMPTIEDIAHYKCQLSQDALDDIKYLHSILHILHLLTKIARTLAIYLKRERLGDRLASLLEATSAIESVHSELEHTLSEARVQKSKLPESLILETLLVRWRTLVVMELGRLRGRADLKPELRTRAASLETHVGIWLDIRNEGRSPADNVRVTLKENADFLIVGADVCEFETVPASDVVIAEFTIKPVTTTPHLTFELLYADAESKERKQSFGDRLELWAPTQTFRRVRNPYSVGTPLQTSEMFYGREKDLAMIREDLTTTAANIVVVLYGERRSGKSSLLYQLSKLPGLEPHIPVHIDLQHETLHMSTSRLLHHLAIAIQRSMAAQKIEIPPPCAQDFSSDPAFAFDQFLDTVEQARQQRKLIIMIDEFELLEQKVQEKVLDDEIYEYLRSLMQHRLGINFLLSGTHTIEQLTKEYKSVFFNIARHHHLSKLGEEAARQLITEPVKGHLEYDPYAVEKIRQLAADQPYFIQIICRSLVSHCNEARKSYITINDVNTVQERVMETGEIHFKWLWGQISLEERLVLAIVAQEGGDEGRSVSLKDVEEVYRHYNLPYQHESVLHALDNLSNKDIIGGVSESTRFKILIGLTRRWLRETKSLRRVMLEENLFTH